MFPDLVLLSARLLDPGTGSLLPHTALAAGGGRITYLGDDREVRALAGPATTVIDLKGAVVTAGFTDGHIHPVSGAERTMGVDLSGCRDLAAVRTALAERAATLAPGVWLRGWGLDPNAFGDAPVAAASLGPVVDGIPTLIDLFDGHSVLASARALELAGVDGPRRFEQAAEIVCDHAGRPTGLLLEDAACELVEAAAPKATEAEVRARTGEVLREMAAAGLTGGHAMDAGGATLAILGALETDGGLPLRLRVAPWCQPGADADAVAELVRLQGTGGALWRVAGVKMFMDGTIDNGTAWLERPDCHGESAHAFWPDPDQYRWVVGELHRAGVPTATHAIGDAAVRHVLDSVERAQGAGGAPVRHRVEHIETVPDDTVPRFARLGVTASMQPTHCCEYTRADHTDNWSRRLGEERASRAFRCRDLWEAGARVVLGSDWPIAPFPPLGVMAGARHRRPGDLSLPPHGPEQALTPLQALRGITLNPAWVAGEEDRAGRLAVGYRADLTVLAGNPLDVADADLAGLPVLLTVVDGRPTHRADGL
ncbi:amidohydrolase [Streptomyces sp. NPDC021356]|uniref:amidohydrolase n=1 Tax=Streptomyces sp. NPDC021356 TaxID=3154900 RepID=UPI0033F0354F